MKMNFILIIIGVVLIAIGVGMSLGKDKEKEELNNSIQIDKKEPSSVSSNVSTGSATKSTFKEESSPKEGYEKKKADAKEVGNDFEDYVANIFHSHGLRIKEWNKGSVTEAGAFAENALNPDMFIIDDSGDQKLEYWIECKYRSSIPEKGFELKEYQQNRYSDVQRDSKRKILVALGLGGSPKNPDALYLIPLDSLKRFKHIPQKYLSNYIVPAPVANMKKHIRNYFFNEVFKKR